MALTLPYAVRATPLVIAVYQRSSEAEAPASARVALRFEGITANRIRIALVGQTALGPIMLVSNGIIECKPYVGSLQALESKPFAGGDSPHAVDAMGRPAGKAAAFEAEVETTVSRQECTLSAIARRYDFSTYGMEVLSGYRYLEDQHGTQFLPSDQHLRPLQNYTVLLDEAIEEAHFDGGTSINDRPTARELTGTDSSLSARWKDPHLANFREFTLFILAGAFALGTSMLIELIKPRFLEV